MKSKIYYDGLCILCSKEIEHYKKQQGSDKFDFIDICDPVFNPSEHGVDPFQVHKIFHVKKSNGVLLTGVEAFRFIWSQLPRYQRLYAMTDNIFAKKVLNFGYDLFIKIRPLLPRKKSDCSASPYCEINQNL